MAVLAAALLAGCSEAKTDDPSACQGAFCGPACASDLDCPLGTVCQAGACKEPEPDTVTCRSDVQCAPDEVCRQGVCEPDDDRCERNSDCPDGQLCDRDSRTCIQEDDDEPDADDPPDIPDPPQDVDPPRDVAPPMDVPPDEPEPPDAEPDIIEPQDVDQDPQVDAEPDIVEPQDVEADLVDPPEDVQDDVQEPEDVPEDIDEPEDVQDDAQEPEDTQDDVEEDVGPPPTPERGVYNYQRLPVGGLNEAVRVGFHPDGAYAVILNYRNNVHIFDWQTQQATVYDLSAPGLDVYWLDMAFDPQGRFALLVGYTIDNDDQEQGIIVKLDDAALRSLQNQEEIFTDYGLNTEGRLAAVEYPWEEGGDPVVLERRENPDIATLRGFDPETGQWTDFLTSQASGAGCDDIAFVNNEFDEPGILVVCGGGGADVLYYTEVGGIGQWRVDPGNNNLGNTSRVAAYPGGQYALVVSWSGRSIYRFQSGLLNGYSDAPRYSRLGLWSVTFQPNGSRALITGRAGISPVRGTNIEYRHDLYRCPSVNNDCDLTEVSIPGFDQPPFNGDRNTNLNEAAFHPLCDGGLMVGGYTNFQGSNGTVIRFDIEGGQDCDALQE